MHVEVIKIPMSPILKILRKMRLSKGEEPTQDLRAGELQTLEPAH